MFRSFNICLKFFENTREHNTTCALGVRTLLSSYADRVYVPLPFRILYREVMCIERNTDEEKKIGEKKTTKT